MIQVMVRLNYFYLNTLHSAIAKFIRKRGTGIHHICLSVENIDEAINELKENNVETIGNNYTYGAEGYKVIFIHPRSTGGVLLELAENLLIIKN